VTHQKVLTHCQWQVGGCPQTLLRREEVRIMAHRSAISGRYISKAAAARHPKTSVTETGGNKSSGSRNRSAITGRYITDAAAARHPKTSVTENGK